MAMLFLLLPFSWALNIDSYRIAAEKEGGSANIALFIYVSNNNSEPVGTVVLSVPPDSSIISAGDFYGPVGYEKAGPSLRLNLSTPIGQGGSRLILAELSSKSVLSGKGALSEYLLIFTPPQDIADFEHTFRIPEAGKKQVHFVSPPAEIGLSDGSLLVHWKMPLRAGVSQPFIVRFEEARTDYTPALLLILLFVLAYLAHGFSKKYISARRKEKQIDSLKILNERERVVVEAVVRSPGTSQSSLQQKFGYTKASMSKIVSKLAYREIILKKKHGKTNHLYPGKKLKDG